MGTPEFLIELCFPSSFRVLATLDGVVSSVLFPCNPRLGQPSIVIEDRTITDIDHVNNVVQFCEFLVTSIPSIVCSHVLLLAVDNKESV